MAALISRHPVQKSVAVHFNPSRQSCTSTSKYLFYLVLWNPFMKFIRVFA